MNLWLNVFDLSTPNRRKFSLYWTGLITTCLVAFSITAWCMIVKPLQFQAPTSGSYGDFTTALPVSLTAEAVSADPISRTIVMNWYPTFTTLNCSSTSVVMDIFIYSAILDTSSPSWSPQLGDQPAYRVNSTEICFGLISTFSSFQTVTKLIASKEYLKLQAIALQSNFQSYPFDIYLAPFQFYTQNVNTGEILPLVVTDAFGVAVNFKISLLNNAILNLNNIQNSIQFYLLIERSLATKAFVTVVGVTNWLIAIAFLTICVALVVFRSAEIYREMFVVPVTTLFAFSSIRANFPGAPAGFGATIDTFTILPVLIIMSFCSFALLITILYRRIYEDAKKESGTDVEKAMMPTPLPFRPYRVHRSYPRSISKTDRKGFPHFLKGFRVPRDVKKQ